MAKPIQLHPRHHRRAPADGPLHHGPHAFPARAQRLSSHRPRQVDPPQLRPGPRLQGPLQPAHGRHQPRDRGHGVRQRHQRGRPLARLRLGRPRVLRLRLLRAALRLGRRPHQERRRLRLRPDRRPGPRVPGHREQARHAEPLPRPHRRGEPRPLRPDAGRRVPGRLEDPAGQDRHGLAEHAPARPAHVPDPARAPLPPRRRLVHLSDLRLGPRPERLHRGRHPFDLHPRVRGPPAALRLVPRPARRLTIPSRSSSPGST